MNAIVDIVLATYQGEKYIEQQIQSILEQTHSSFRLIIRDDASSDRTPELLLKWQALHPDRITVHLGTIRKGVIQNFWDLIALTDSPYVMFSDQDDVWKKEKIALSLHAIKIAEERNPGIPILVHTDLEVVDENLKPIASSYWKFSHLNPSQGHTLNRLLVQNIVTGCTCLSNRALIDLLPKKMPRTLMHDWWLSLTAAAFGKIVAISESTIQYRQHSHNALGAQAFTLKRCFNKAKMYMGEPKLWKEQQRKKQQQTADFFEIYQSLLSVKQKQMLEAFLKASQTSWIKRKVVYFKYQFYWHGFLRNSFRFILNYPF